MEQEEEEEKIQIYGRKKRRQSSSSSKPSSSVHIDLVTEILLKLPTKSIVRSRCVSKLWSSITADPIFINSYETRFRPKQSLLLFFRQKSKLVVLSFPQHGRNLNGGSYSSYSSHHVDHYQINYSEHLRFSSSTESVQGLICFRTSAAAVIWNPSKRQFLTLPKPDKIRTSGITVFLGYDPIERKHKLVCMPIVRFSNECMVLTLGSSSAQELSWRRIKTNHYHRPLPCLLGNGRCVNGVLYYKAHIGFDKQHGLMSFNVRSETFQPVRLPLHTWWGLLIPYEGRLAFVRNQSNGKNMKLWVLEDAEKGEWSDKHFGASMSIYDETLETNFKLRSVTDGGEFIYVPSKCSTSSGMVYFDPKRDSFRKFVFEGIVDDEFRLSNGLGDFPLCPLQAFPNHIDSLITW